MAVHAVKEIPSPTSVNFSLVRVGFTCSSSIGNKNCYVSKPHSCKPTFKETGRTLARVYTVVATSGFLNPP
jgi:hypothetical protein